MLGHGTVETIRSRHDRQEGSAFLIVVLLTLVVTALGTTMLVMSNTDHLISANERDAERALYASKGGLGYAFSLFRDTLLVPTAAGASFNSFAASVSGPMDGQAFTGKMYDMSAVLNRGQLYRIESTGTYGRSTRTTEMVVEIIPESFKYGYMAFSSATLHNHSGLSGPTFRIETTIFSNGSVEIPDNITVDGSIVAADGVTVKAGATVTKDIFANSLNNNGTIEGNVVTLTAVQELESGAATWDRLDNIGNKYDWYAGNSSPGPVAGGGTILGTTSSHTIANGEEFRYTIFRRDGSMITDPDVNVTKYVPPPLLDYKAMKVEADKYEPTYFTSMTAAMTYLASKKVTEVIDGKTVTTIRVGTDTFPEFLYVRGDFNLTVDHLLAADNLSTGLLKAHGFNLEGGIYASGSVEIHSRTFDPAVHPAPPNYYSIRINALPYCLPAITAYAEPAAGTIDDWLPNDTPAMGGGSSFKMSSSISPHEGFT